MSSRVSKLTSFLIVAATCLVLIACNSDKEAATSCVPSSCATNESLPTPAVVENPVYPGADWETSSPEAEGMDAAPLDNIDAYCVEHGCRAVVVLRHGRIVWERYWGTGTRRPPTIAGRWRRAWSAPSSASPSMTGR